MAIPTIAASILSHKVAKSELPRLHKTAMCLTLVGGIYALGWHVGSLIVTNKLAEIDRKPDSHIGFTEDDLEIIFRRADS